VCVLPPSRPLSLSLSLSRLNTVDCNGAPLR
jgi:hypothetical protein